MIWIRALFSGAVVGIGLVGIEALQLTIGYQAGYLIGVGLIMTGALILMDYLTQ
jgi:hypothetical protein